MTRSAHQFRSLNDDVLWRILVADGAPPVHQRIKKILGKETYNDRGIRIYSAYSAEATLDFLTKNPNTAVLIYSSVLNVQESGLEIGRHVRKRLGSQSIRLIRIAGPTGPEEPGADDCDLSGCLDTEELEGGGLLDFVTSALRDYDRKKIIKTIRDSLSMVLGSIADLNLKSSWNFSSGLLTQLLAGMELGGDAVYCRKKTDGAGLFDFYAASATARYADCMNKDITALFPEPLLKDIKEAVSRKMSIFAHNHLVFYAHDNKTPESLLIFRNCKNQELFDSDLAILFARSMVFFLDRVNLHINLDACLKEAVLIIDPSNTVLTYNQCFSETLGRFAGIRKGMKMERFMNELGRHAVKNEENEYAINLLKSTEADSGAGELKIKQSGYKIFSFYIKAMADMAGSNAGKIVVFYDITDNKIQIEHLQNECRTQSKLNEKNELIINSINNHIKAQTEENNRFVNNYVEAMLNIVIDNLMLMMNTITYNHKFRKKIGDIIAKIEYEKSDIGRFISNIEQKQTELAGVFKSFVSDTAAHKALKMKETGLDDREISIVQMIASLKSNKEIAKELGYEEDTIKNKITVIRRKLKLTDRCHLVSFAFRNGLV